MDRRPSAFPCLLPPAAERPVPEIMVGRAEDSVQPALPLASAGVQRWVWHGRFGEMLIEVVEGVVYVNGQRVEPHVP